MDLKRSILNLKRFRLIRTLCKNLKTSISQELLLIQKALINQQFRKFRRTKAGQQSIASKMEIVYNYQVRTVLN